MPYMTAMHEGKHCVYKKGEGGKPMGDPLGCHDSEEGAKRQMRAVMASEGKSGSKAAIFKGLDGAWRWFGWVSNWYRDNDSPREILSGKAHRAYVKAVEETSRYPELWLWHVPGSRVGAADWLAFSDGFLMASGTIDKEMADVAEKMTADGDLTMSHGFVRLKHDKKEVITDSYWMFECSGLPSSAEANPWTNLSALKEVTMPLPKAKRDFLVAKLGEERVKGIEENTTQLKAAAEAAGVDWKEVETLEPEATPVAAATTPATTTPASAPLNATIETSQIVEAVAAQLVERLQLKDLSGFLTDMKTRLDAFAALSGQVEAIQAEVKALKQTDDEKVAKALTPKGLEIPPFVWMQKAASQAEATKLDEAKPEDAALKTAGPTAMDRLLGGIFGAQGLPGAS